MDIDRKFQKDQDRNQNLYV